MMTHQIVFLDGRAERLYADDSVEVLETFDFGDAGAAAKVRHVDGDTIDSAATLTTDGVQGIEPDTDEFELRTTTNPTADSVATIEDVRGLHHLSKSGNTGKGIHVAVMDSGIDESHPLFADTTVNHVDVTGRGQKDEVGHGTACAGQIIRLAPDVTLTSLRIFGKKGRTSMSVILRAYEWLFANADKVDVVNMSWGSSRKVAKLDELQNKLVAKGVRDVTAAGNSGGAGGSPATAQKAFSVGACTQGGEMAPFSSHNPDADNPDVTAIGVNNRLAQARDTIMGDNLTGRWVKASGTSFAAPETTGAVARYLQTRKSDGLVKSYEANADDLNGTNRDGAGFVNHAATMGESPDEPEPPVADATVWSLWDKGQDVAYINKDWLPDGGYRVAKVADSDDRTVLEFRPK